MRWTEKRNLEEFIRLISTGAVSVEPLIGGTYPVERVQEAFDAVRTRTLPGVAALISYDGEPDRRTDDRADAAAQGGRQGGHLADRLRQPRARHASAQPALDGATSSCAASARLPAATRRSRPSGLGATMITTDVDEVLADSGTDAVMICSNQPEHYEHIRAAVRRARRSSSRSPWSPGSTISASCSS